MDRPRLPSTILALGFVSLFMDISSEMIHSLLPVFMVTMLGANITLVGVIEGSADAIAQVTKIFSGSLSDYLRKRKPLVLAGYLMAACSKPLLPLATHLSTAVAGRFLDRVGKGVRDAPRDALIGDITPAQLRGAAFGLRQSLDNVGAILGPLLALLFMYLLADMRNVLWLAVIPAFIAVGILALGVKEPETHAAGSKPPFRFRDIRSISKGYWLWVAVATLLTLARFSEAFLILKAQAMGIPVALAPMVLVVMNIIYALSAYPIGQISDRIGRKGLLVAGTMLLLSADLVLANAHTPLMLVLGVSLWGLHLGSTQGILSAMIADTAPAELRGTAFGIYNFAAGIALLAASVIAGGLWDLRGPEAAFYGGAMFTLLAIMGLLVAGKK